MRYLLLALALLLAGCGGGGGGGSAPPPSSGAAPATTGTLVIQHAPARALPAGATDLRIVGRDSDGTTRFGPETRTPANEIRLPGVPVTVTQVTLEYLQGQRLLGIFTGPVDLRSGQATLSDPLWLDVPARMVGLEVTPATQSVPQGSERTLAAFALFDDGSRQDVTGIAAWASSNDAVVMVGQGRLVGVSLGEADVTALVEVYSDSAHVTVTPP